MFVVVVCGACRRPQVAEARHLKPGCRGCGRPLPWQERKIFYQGEDGDEARRVAAKLSLEVGRAGIEAVAESTAAAERERVATVEDVLDRLSRANEFGLVEISEAVRGARFSWSPDRVAEWLLREQRVYEPRPGRFRWLA